MSDALLPEEIVAAVDSIKNPFASATKAQEDLVITAALRMADSLNGSSHDEAIYSPEVLGAMHAYLAKSQGSPTLALRLAVADLLSTQPTQGEE